jgi:hypothetical protein
MELELLRTYHTKGTNGDLLHGGLALCHTIELPWNDNKRRISCIPEGRYELTKRYSRKCKWHILVNNVAGRDLVLIHPANSAVKELHGCIAPVTRLTGPGTGSSSRVVFEKLKKLIYAALERKEQVFITIKAKEDEHSSPGKSANT